MAGRVSTDGVPTTRALIFRSSDGALEVSVDRAVRDKPTVNVSLVHGVTAKLSAADTKQLTIALMNERIR